MTVIKKLASVREMEMYQTLLARDTLTGEKARRIVEYAEREGGLTLQYWRLKKGPLFGTPDVCSMEWCAKELDIPLSDVIDINKRTWDWVVEQTALW